MSRAVSHVIDDGKTRLVACIEGNAAVIHATKYGYSSTALVTASMPKADAYQLGLWLIQHAKP